MGTTVSIFTFFIILPKLKGALLFFYGFEADLLSLTLLELLPLDELSEILVLFLCSDGLSMISLLSES